MIKKIRINEDYTQRLNYFVKQYGDGFLSCDYFDYVLFNEFGNDCDYDTYTKDSIPAIYVDISTKEDKIRNGIFNFITNDLYNYYGLDVSSSYLKQNCFITGDALCISVNFDWDTDSATYYGDEFSLDKLDSYAEFDLNGKYSITANYGFEINDKTVRGKDLALLLGIEYIG